MLWFAHGTVDDKCPDRVLVAKELLQTDAANLPPTARKVKKLFFKELIQVIGADGECPVALYVPFRMLACKWRADTQEIEGIMSMIQAAMKVAPNMSLP